MKLHKRFAVVFLAAVISLSGVSAFAAAPVGTTDFLPDSVTAENTPQESSPKQSGSGEEAESAEGVYTPINTEGWQEWDGSSELLENTNYYISETAGIGKDKTVLLPKSSTLLVGENAQLLIYLGGTLNVEGTLITAPDSYFLNSGTLSVYGGGSLSSFGESAFSVSSVTDVSSTVVAGKDSKFTFSGKMNIYKSGKLTIYNSASFTGNSVVTVTGILRIAEGGALSAGGELLVTLSGRLSDAGRIILLNKLSNSGIFTIESNAQLFTVNKGENIRTKSGRMVDFREAPKLSETGEYEYVNGMKGIDVSVWQGVIDWQKVKEAGVQFAIIRSSHSADTVDKMFEYNITEAHKAGILVGVYHYCYAKNIIEAYREANHFIETIRPYKIDFPVMFDFEDNSQVSLGKQNLTNIAAVFLGTVKNAGYYPMIYSYKNWLTNLVDMDKLKNYEVAVAEWNVQEPTYAGEYGVWQYSCKGLVSGIEGDVDLDLCFKDYARIIREGGWNHLDEFDPPTEEPTA